MRNSILFIIIASFILTSCSKDFLNAEVQSALTEEDVSSASTVDGLVIAAYAWLPHEGTLNSKLSPWLASMKSDESYKGGGGLGDQSPWYQWEVFSLVTPDVGNNDGMWFSSFEGISRYNTALKALNNLDQSEYPLKEQRIAEMRFLRGVQYIQLKRWYKWVPYIDESMTASDIDSLANRNSDAVNDLYLWQDILNDFKAAAAVLPEEQTEVGRPSKYAAMAFSAECLMWMAYEQDLNNQVVNINKTTLTDALEVLNNIINSGRFKLADDFGDLFLTISRNNLSSTIWEWQYSHSDGTPNGNLNGSTPLNAPWWPPHFNCCDFHKPSYTMVNAFKVSSDGLPLFDTYNNENISDKNTYFNNNTWDVRLAHSVSIPGLPWKYQTDLIYDSVATRSPENYPRFNSLKENLQSTSSSLIDLFWMWNSRNVAPIRFDRILLWKAECLIQLGREGEALPIINEIRQRANNSTGKLVFANGNPTLDYNTGLYIDGVNCNWTPEFALDALRWEDRLEFALEGERWFDIVRWGIAADVMNSYFEADRNRQGPSVWMRDGKFVNGRDEFAPIPQAQINLAGPVYKQNPGY